MIDGTNTTYDWQKHPTDTCVLLAASVEQHSRHLPLISDCIEGEFFARMIADALDAALLPTLCYGNCLEHTGFRGSVTLRPETLMQVVRDLAEEMERQSFRVMILVNGHGGNFCLVPTARDINRMNRPLKIILINWWEFADRDLSIETVGEGQEIHAGAWETSLMLAIRPDLVRLERTDMTARGSEKFPLQQRDLTTFGTGHFATAGAIGFPSKANVETGRAIIASVRKNLIPYIIDRVERVKRMPRYSGDAGADWMKGGDP